jgi:hypothetical protein
MKPKMFKFRGDKVVGVEKANKWYAIRQMVFHFLMCNFFFTDNLLVVVGLRCHSVGPSNIGCVEWGVQKVGIG